MSIKPILFNTDMVRAILDGRKTVTRRKIPIDVVNYCDIDTDGTLLSYENDCGDFIEPEKLCQYKQGDILYVRETVWQKVGYYLDVDGETKPSWYKEFKYTATDEKPETGWNYSWAKRPSIHMPKEAARIWLKVKDVRVERLQEITEEQAKAEGAKQCYEQINTIENRPVTYIAEDGNGYYILGFKSIWNSTIKKSDLDRYGWDANPWVWVIEFERCEKLENF